MLSFRSTLTTWHCPSAAAERRPFSNRLISSARRAHSSKPEAAARPDLAGGRPDAQINYGSLDGRLEKLNNCGSRQSEGLRRTLVVLRHCHAGVPFTRASNIVGIFHALNYLHYVTDRQTDRQMDGQTPE